MNILMRALSTNKPAKKHYWPDQIKEHEMGWACGTSGAADNCYIVLGKPEENEATKEDLGVNVKR